MATYPKVYRYVCYYPTNPSENYVLLCADSYYNWTDDNDYYDSFFPPKGPYNFTVWDVTDGSDEHELSIVLSNAIIESANCPDFVNGDLYVQTARMDVTPISSLSDYFIATFAVENAGLGSYSLYLSLAT